MIHIWNVLGGRCVCGGRGGGGSWGVRTPHLHLDENLNSITRVNASCTYLSARNACLFVI